ncbi:adenylate/guanylate cyclase domain-containing protein [Leptospira sp. WS58.C1]|uniref:adenylate/guanylate cyclase domain-containing protein n=1 Tax=Leptospira TaxID=171 RepID=UPI0002BE58E1|nr:MULTISPECIES: adenylate/guanylate cyclase domain-containing protein [unclassified Leptospira]EMJ98993.1 adenylate/guanylate cyclase catalytic domain protein [Leptospira sp. B5-022]MCR1794176.1 adenylate/guanylate cyclase domain-containing protein [Leptospira sp. id769339]
MAFKRSIFASASEDRLENLVLERLKPGADKEKIDARIWDLFGEVWCIMFTDLSGFSRGVEKFGIIHFLQTIHESERVLVPIIEDHDGILLKSEGDSFLVIFRNVAKGLQAAIRMQKELLEYNKDKIPEEKILLCVGLGYGKVLKIGDSDVFGSEVNTASKLGEDTAEAGEILVTQTVFDNAQDTGLKFEPIKDVPAGTQGAYRVLY